MQENDDGTLEADVNHTIDRDGDAESVGLLVRVVLWHPSKLKGARPLAGDGLPRTNSDVCISIHRRIASDSTGSGVISCSRDTATVSTRLLTTGLQKIFGCSIRLAFTPGAVPGLCNTGLQVYHCRPGKLQPSGIHTRC